ncbi:unknown [Bacteroides sp. CAG:144]|nr:unknown [Bacteroides sp. CAG:144]
MSGLYRAYVDAYALHDFHTVFKGEYNTLLGCAHEMITVVPVVVDAVDRRADFFILQDTFGTVAEWHDTHSVATDVYLRCQQVHARIRSIFGSDVAFYP